MRKLLISLMAASMLAPAAAQAKDGDFVRAMRSHAEKSNRSDSRSGDRSARRQSSEHIDRSSADRPERVDRASREDRIQRIERVQNLGGNQDSDGEVRRHERVRRSDDDIRRVERVRRGDRDGRQIEQVQVNQPVQTNEPVQSTQQTERRFDGLAGAFGRAGRDISDGRTGDRDGDRHWRRDRDGDGDRDWRDRDGRHHRWDRDWRRNHRYDWSRHRNHYRSLFRLGHYYDPYGWGYRRFSIGFSLWPSYYGSSFWLNDPWQYRLPPVYGPYRWIRYYDDALLVNIYTGQVVDVEYNVFW